MPTKEVVELLHKARGPRAIIQLLSEWACHNWLVAIIQLLPEWACHNWLVAKTG